MPNSIDPDEMAHYEPSHLDLCCLQKPIVIPYGSERERKIKAIAGAECAGSLLCIVYTASNHISS